MPILFLALLIAFPIAEIWILISLADEYGWWLLLYLVVVTLLGLQLIREEKLLFSGKMLQSLMQGGSPIKAVFGSARNIIAGFLLVMPGVLTDIIAAILLLIPVKKSQAQHTQFTNKPAANDDVIEGEFTRED